MSETETIPFNRAGVEGHELEYLRRSVESGHTASGGPFTEQAASLLREVTGAHEVLLTTSCTTALELSAMLLGLGPDDTVVLPSFTFSSSALAFAREGARLLFCDIERETLGLDPEHLASLLDDSVRVVVPVHYAGIGCDMDGVHDALSGHPDVSVVEDNAHGLLGTWRGQPLGTLGRFASLSFHETKNFVCGEGGALLINDEADVARARVLHEKGTDRRAFMLGQVDKYTWRDTGSSFGMSDTLAAYLLAQLEQRASIQEKRRRLREHYHAALAPHAEELGFHVPRVPTDRGPAHHLFYVLLPDVETRDRVLSRMRADGVQATFHYVPLHTSDAGRRFSVRPTDCPVTEEISGRLLRLPFFNGITSAQADRVVSSFLKACAEVQSS